MNMSLDSIHEDIMVGAGYTTAAAASRRGSYEASMEEEEDDEGGEGDKMCFLLNLAHITRLLPPTSIAISP